MRREVMMRRKWWLGGESVWVAPIRRFKKSNMQKEKWRAVSVSNEKKGENLLDAYKGKYKKNKNKT